MATATPRLTAAFVEKVRRPGKYYDTFGLYLRVSGTGHRYWEQRLTVNGRRRTLGLGPYPVVTLKAARAEALENHRIVQHGDDPVALKRRHSVPTFAEAAEEVLKLRRAGWTSPKMERNWRTTFERHLFPPLGGRRVCDIKARHVLEVLQPIINRFPKSLSRVRQRIAVVLKWAVVNGYRADNPAELITGLLPSTESRHTHHRALPYAEVPRALAAVRRCDAWPGTKLLFEFLVLTAVRTEEARGALWSEIHADSAMWVLPPARMKMRAEHRVPLSTRALAVLDEARSLPAGDGCGLVFLSQSGRKFYNNALSKLLQDLCIPCVPHGFRSSFRDWAGETEVPREVAEACLAHRVANEVEAAYARSDLYTRRIGVMEDWAQYLDPSPLPDA